MNPETKRQLLYNLLQNYNNVIEVQRLLSDHPELLNESLKGRGTILTHTVIEAESAVDFSNESDRKSCLAVLEYLLTLPDLEINQLDESGKSALHCASRYDPIVVSMLLKHPKINVNLLNKDGYAALHFASEMDNADILRLLLAVPQLDVNIVIQDEDGGGTALHQACHHSYQTAVRMLLSHPNIDPTIRNKEGLMASEDCYGDKKDIRLVQEMINQYPLMKTGSLSFAKKREESHDADDDADSDDADSDEQPSKRARVGTIRLEFDAGEDFPSLCAEELKDGKFLLTMSVGDLETDGHGMKDVFAIKSSFSPVDFISAYHAGPNSLGFDICRMCKEHEDSTIPEEFAAALDAAGFEPQEARGYEMEYPDALNPDLFKQIFLFTVKRGNPQFEWAGLMVPAFHLGGYGLYFN